MFFALLRRLLCFDPDERLAAKEALMVWVYLEHMGCNLLFSMGKESRAWLCIYLHGVYISSVLSGWMMRVAG